MNKDKADQPFLPSCINCVHLGDPKHPICSAVKAIQAVRIQWEIEYPYVKFPDSHLDLAKFCKHYTPLNDARYVTPKEQEDGV